MRRTDREITDREEIDRILSSQTVCRLGVCFEDVPYVVPMNYGYSGGALYFHSATSGQKIDMITRNPEVCFEIEGEAEIVPKDQACKWSTKYISIVGYGRIELLKEANQKIEGLSVIMAQCSGTDAWEYEPSSIEKVLVMRLPIRSMSCKRAE